jgi:integrase
MNTVHPIRDRRKINSVKKILHANNLRDYCIFVLGINCGLRVSDLIRFTIADIINEKGELREHVTTIEEDALREEKTDQCDQ